MAYPLSFRDNYFTLNDWMNMYLTSENLNVWFNELVGKSLDSQYGNNFSSMLASKIKSICTNIKYCLIVGDDGEFINKGLQFPEYINDYLSGCVKINLEGLANAKDGANIAQDWKLGKQHTQLARAIATSNDLDNTDNALDPTIYQDHITFSQLEIQTQQNQVINQFRDDFESMRNGFIQFLDTQEANSYSAFVNSDV